MGWIRNVSASRNKARCTVFCALHALKRTVHFLTSTSVCRSKLTWTECELFLSLTAHQHDFIIHLLFLRSKKKAMSQLTATDRESPSSTQESSFLSLTEACRACERYGHVVDCESHDLRPDMYFHLAGNMLKPVQNQVYTSSTTSSEKHMLWHANILGENPDFISQIIKNLIRYSEDYICEEYAEHIEKALENCDVHVYRECRFICEIIESLQVSFICYYSIIKEYLYIYFRRVERMICWSSWDDTTKITKKTCLISVQKIFVTQDSFHYSPWFFSKRLVSKLRWALTKSSK